MNKRHRWVDDKCIHCDLRRRLEDARSQRGCFGTRYFKRMIYRVPSGAQVWWPNMGRKVPLCRPHRA